MHDVTAELSVLREVEMGGPLAINLFLIAYVYLLWFRPAGLTIFGAAVHGVGLCPIPFIGSYARLTVLLQAVVVLVLFLRLALRRRWDTKRWSDTGLALIPTLVLAIIWSKIVFETAIGGFEPAQRFELRWGIIEVVFPVATMLLCLFLYEADRFVYDLCLGLAVYGLLWTLIPLYFAAVDGRLALAMVGQLRLVLFGLDTINSARMPFFGAVGWLALALMRGRTWRMRAIQGGLTVFLVMVILLNGSRQFILGLVIMIALALLGARLKRAIVVSGFVIVLVGGLLLQIVNTSSAVQRIQPSELSEELTSLRGAIWKDAFFAGLDHPLGGVGFKKFGETGTDTPLVGDDSEVLVSGAHGFLQEVWAEHGVLIFLTLFGSYVFIVSCGALELIQERFTAPSVLFIVSCGIAVTSCMSGSVCNALGFYMLAIQPLIDKNRGRLFLGRVLLVGRTET